MRAIRKIIAFCGVINYFRCISVRCDKAVPGFHEKYELCCIDRIKIKFVRCGIFTTVSRLWYSGV
jgi:hypothetical protein